MSSRRNSTSSMARKTPKSTPNLLKQALTKTIFSDETPNQSANNTAVGVEKAKTQFNLFKVVYFIFFFSHLDSPCIFNLGYAKDDFGRETGG